MASCPLRTLSSPHHGIEGLSESCLGPFIYHLVLTTLTHICLLQPHWLPFSSLKMSSASGFLYFLFLCLKMSFLAYLCSLLILFKPLVKCHLLRLSRLLHLKYLIFPSCLYALILLYIMTLSVDLPAPVMCKCKRGQQICFCLLL